MLPGTAVCALSSGGYWCWSADPLVDNCVAGTKFGLPREDGVRIRAFQGFSNKRFPFIWLVTLLLLECCLKNADDPQGWRGFAPPPRGNPCLILARPAHQRRTRMHTHTHPRTHPHTHTLIHTHTHSHTHTRTFTHTNTQSPIFEADGFD